MATERDEWIRREFEAARKQNASLPEWLRIARDFVQKTAKSEEVSDSAEPIIKHR